MHRTALLTVSDTSPSDDPEDRTVQAIREVLERGPFVEVDYARVPSEQARVRAQLRLWSDAGRTDLVLTSGGIGLAPRDRAPEATRDVIDREVPGLAERMRAEGARVDPVAALTRGVAGVRRDTLIVNLPARPSEAADALAAVLPVLPRALQVLRDARTVADDEGTSDREGAGDRTSVAGSPPPPGDDTSGGPA
ncbi:MAG: MogA/MoaB family molybdenum cofactor biosynthesis protein [Trueperaceae bacterium]